MISNLQSNVLPPGAPPGSGAAHYSATVEGLTREQFGQLPRIMQWALAGKYGVPRVERIRDARQERISWSLGKTPGGTGGDPAPHSYYTDDRDLFAEILARPHASGKLGHLGRGGESPNNVTTNPGAKTDHAEALE